MSDTTKDALYRPFEPDETDQIFQSLGETIDEYAAGSALYESNGPGGSLWEMNRKVLLADLKEGIRADFAARTPPEKVTDGRADDLAHVHQEYIAFLDAALGEKTAYRKLYAERLDQHARLRYLDRRGGR